MKEQSPQGKRIGIKAIHYPNVTVDLDDGVRLRIAINVMDVVRSDKITDQNGNPVYHVEFGANIKTDHSSVSPQGQKRYGNYPIN